MIKLLRVLKEDRFLHSLALGYNHLFEEANEVFSSEKGGFARDVPLGAFNEEAIACLKQLVTFNINLVHLDV